MKKLCLVVGLILLAGFVFGQDRQTGQNMLQGRWVSTESSSGIDLGRWGCNMEFKGSNATVFWFTDAYPDLPFTYNNNRLIINWSNGNTFINSTCAIIGNELILLFSEGWIIFRKE